MEILSGEQMRRVDRRAIDELGLPSLTLMEAAGRGVAETLLEDRPEARRLGVTVLCGSGSNGGDGLVAARHLARAGVAVRVLLLASAERLTADAAVNLTRARETGLDVQQVTEESAWAALAPSIGSGSIVLDALLGTGVRGGARGLIARAIEAVNASGAYVVAVDLPSGVDPDSFTVEGVAMRARRTYTLVRPKVGLVLGQAAELAGSWRVIPIGIPDSAVSEAGAQLEWFDREAARRLWIDRDDASHKGTFGHLLAVAGSRDRGGAAVLVARGALRAGVGLVTVATPTSVRERIAAQQAEMMTAALPETAAGELARAAGEAALAVAQGKDALAIGPGLGTTSETADAVLDVLRGLNVPVVVDADALNTVAREPNGAAALGLARELAILTPHPGEAGRLLGRTTAEVQSDRLASARTLASTSGTVVVLKGHRTLVAAPDGRVAVNATGNPGLASGGTGDVLTGIVGALLARGFSRWDAARLGVWAHGRAGDLVAARIGMDGMIASDVAEALPHALRELSGSMRDTGSAP